MSLGWTLSGPAAFDGLWLERAALTSLVAKSDLVPLVTSSVRSVRLRMRFPRQSSLVRFNELTDLFMFMKTLAFRRWLTQALQLWVMMWVLLLGLLSLSLFSTHHISLIPFASSTMHCQIPPFTSVVSQDTSSFRLLFFLNTVRTIRYELENCNGGYEAVARRKQHSRRSVCVPTAEFLENLQKKSWRSQASEL